MDRPARAGRQSLRPRPAVVVTLPKRPGTRGVLDGILFLEPSPFVTGEILHIEGGQIAGH
jgi:hypothetical protein